MLRIFFPFFWSALFLLVACGCPNSGVPNPTPSVYYWKSDFHLSMAEKQFLHDHRIGKLYLHLFDVVREGTTLHPSSTVRFTDSLPADIQVIPVVFLNFDILNDTTGTAELPQLLARRVRRMMELNGGCLPQELQVDFDWTARNETLYFQLLAQLRDALQKEGIPRLSATIRLHQLARPIPPVDYGALMVYNVGNYANPRERCSILTPQLVRPYLPYLSSYRLPLCSALPVYQWNLLYHRDHFECILRGVNLLDTTKFERIDDIHYRSLSYQAIPIGTISMQGDGRILPGDVVRHERVSAAMLDSVRLMLNEVSPACCQQVILYHLDEQQLSSYTYEELESIYMGR